MLSRFKKKTTICNVDPGFEDGLKTVHKGATRFCRNNHKLSGIDLSKITIFMDPKDGVRADCI